MKQRKKIILKILMINIFMLFLINISYGYQIKNIAITKEELNELGDIGIVRRWNFPQILYKKQVSAFEDTITKWNNGDFIIGDTGWAYAEENFGSDITDNNYYFNDTEHGNDRSFERYYEYFHKNQNSEYSIAAGSDKAYRAPRFYSTGNIWTQALPELSYMSYKKVYDVSEESDNYSGFYWKSASQSNVAGLRADVEANQDILAFNSNIYRFAIINKVYVTNNYLTSNTVAKMYEVFADLINPENKTLTVYQSSVLRTNSANGKYYQNMDTAFKFWESTIRGNNSNLWHNSPSTRGGNVINSTWGYESVSPQPERSVINYYDNTVELPVSNCGKTIYIRHINVTNKEVINSSTITNADVFDISNERGIAHDPSAWENLKEYVLPNEKNSYPNQNKYTSIYNIYTPNTIWRFGNLLYEYSNTGTGQYFSSLNRSGNLSDSEENILNNYNCIGAVVGKGETLEQAESARNNRLDSVNIRNVALNYSDYYESTTGGVINGSYWTSAIVNSGEESPVIVIDFYYEKKPTEVYVRHIDVTNISNLAGIGYDGGSTYALQTNKGQAFKLNNTDWNISTGSISPSSRDIQPELSAYSYQEKFEKKPNGEIFRVANIKYDHETAGSYWNLLSSSQKTQYNDYTCIGSAVGKGARVDLAEVNRDNALKNAVNNSKIDFVNYSQGSIAQSDDSYIVKNGNYTSEVIYNNDYNVIVVDFYYVKSSCVGSTCTDSTPGYKQVYVRHIDVTDIKNITATNIDEAIRKGKVLSGKGIAKKNGWQNLSKDGGNYSGYQERYTIKSNESLEVFRDPNDNYNCIGSNLATASDNSLDTAKNVLNSKLNATRNKYDSWLTSSRTTNSSDNSDIVIIDFYYTSKHMGKVIDRDKVGRLAFYTTSQTTKFSSKVDNHTNSDKKTVYDVIPSNETLRMSVDNAYTYMLGAINIKEQTIENTYSFNYKLTQPYKVYYKDWSSYCSGTHANDTYSDKKTGYCGYKWTTTYSCSDGKGGTTTCYEYHTCNGNWTADWEWTSTTGNVERTYSYQIPYKYTYYKVKNMRLYTISKIELDDGYDNDGLPLFEGKLYTAQTTDTYKSGFNVGSNGAVFTSSKNEEKVNGKTTNSVSKTLSNTLTYYYDNEDGDVNVSVPKSDSENKINTLFDGISHSDAAKIEKFNGIDSSAYTSASSNLTATLYVKNDEISFKDAVKNSRIYLVGENVNELNTTDSYSKYSRSEKEATKTIDLSKYTTSKTTTKSGSNYVYSVTNSDKVDVATVYPKSTKNKYLPSDSKTNYEGCTDKEKKYGGRDYYNLTNLNIPESRLNGKRYSYGKIYYTLLSGNNVLNFDVDDSKVVNGSHTWNEDSNRKAVTGATGNTFVDTEMYNDKGVASPSKTTLISPGALSDVIWEYGEDNETDADIVDVFTPISFTTKIIGNNNSDIRVDHTIINNNNNKQKQIQKNTRFTIQIDATSNNTTYSGVQTSKYLGQYYVKFNFDVQDIVITDAKGTNREYSSNSASSETWIGPIYNRYNGNSIGTVTVSAYALADPNEASGVVNQEQNEYEVRAVAANASTSLNYDVLRGRISDTTTYITNVQNTFSGTGNNNQDHQKYYSQKNIFGHSNYVAKEVVETENISRVYDFKVTDVKDVDWKNIFRTSTSTTTNVHSGKAYYSGVKKWNIYTTAYNDMVTRSVSEIGATKQQILPVGPYKHTTSTYTKAPKLGYKFSFDLKTTGANANKKVVIEPSFYYIKKDGTGYTDNIELYYKNSSNKYVKIDNYNLYFVPDDGYRLTFEETDQSYRFSSSSISKNTVSLGNTKKITLTSEMMEQADNNFVQIWYGEYKLPNSTIAVAKQENGKFNINEDRLTGGYIGVKFDIKVYEYSSKTMTDANISKVLSYSQNDNNASSNTNTSQWDYEGYLGFSNPGNSANNIKISLEKGIWILNDTMYNKIKGTVMLYDTDATASSDYE